MGRSEEISHPQTVGPDPDRPVPRAEALELVESFLMEAEARGEARGEIRAILTFLQSRFGPVPESVRNKLSGITDPERLERLAAKVGTVQSLDEFAQALQ